MPGNYSINKNMKPYKRIFILGAGFSNSFCDKMPTICDLTKALFAKECLGRYEIRDYPELFEFVDKFNEIDKNVCTIENLTTTIFSRRIYGSPIEQEYYERLKYQILRYILIAIYYHEIDECSEEILIDFLKACRDEHEPNDTLTGKNLIITFNYDLLIEKFMDKMIKVDNIPNRILVHADYGLELG